MVINQNVQNAISFSVYIGIKTTHSENQEFLFLLAVQHPLASWIPLIRFTMSTRLESLTPIIRTVNGTKLL